MAFVVAGGGVWVVVVAGGGVWVVVVAGGLELAWLYVDPASWAPKWSLEPLPSVNPAVHCAHVTTSPWLNPSNNHGPW